MASRCPQCGKLFDEDSGFCPFDGKPLESRVSAGPGVGELVSVASVASVASVIDAPSVSVALERLGPVVSEYDRLIGTVLDGRYRIERKLGEGGMGVVFLARHVVIEKTVAVKVLKRDVARDHSVVQRFVREAKAASRIGHPNIADVTDFGTSSGGMTYSVMEYVEGDTLGKIIRAEAPLLEARVLPIVAQIAKALSAAHEKGIVHRDLKPDNVFVIARDGRRDFVKIVDFGIAKIIPLDGRSESAPRLTHAGAVFGTPEYMAPEQAAGRGDIDHRADIYSLGVIFYEMLLGKVPHKGDTMVRTLAMQMFDEIVPPRRLRPDLGISRDLETVVMKALSKKRGERFQTMYELLAHLEPLAGGVPLEQPLSPGARLVRMAAPPGARTLVPPELDGSASAPLLPSASTDALPTIPTVSEPVPRGLERAPSSPHVSEDAAAKPTFQPDMQMASAAAATGQKKNKNKNKNTSKDAEPKVTSVEKPRTDRKNPIDPAFVRRKRPLSLDMVRQTSADDSPAPKPRLWLAVLAGVVVVAAAGIAMARWAPSSHVPEKSETGRIAAASDPPGEDPLARTEPAGDASVAPSDPAVPGTPQSPTAQVGEVRPRNTRPGTVVRPTSSLSVPSPLEDAAAVELLDVKVLSKPDGATLYVDKNYTGQSGTNIQRARGTVLSVECRLPGHKPGKVQVVFNGIDDIYVCRLERNTRCVKGLKNPFVDCPE